MLCICSGFLPMWISTAMKWLANWLKKGSKTSPHMKLMNVIFVKLFSIRKAMFNLPYMTPLNHHWCKRSIFGTCLFLVCCRRPQTPLSRPADENLKSLSFSEGRNIFASCTKSLHQQVSLEHTLECFPLTRGIVISFLTTSYLGLHPHQQPYVSRLTTMVDGGLATTTMED